MAKKSPLVSVGTIVNQELLADTDQVAKGLKSEIVQPGEQRTSNEFLEHVASLWTDSAYRQHLHEAIGDQGIIEVAQDLFAKYPHLAQDGPSEPRPAATGQDPKLSTTPLFAPKEEASSAPSEPGGGAIPGQSGLPALPPAP